MPQPFKTYTPQDASELLDLLGMMLLSAPTYIDEEGYFPEQTLETVFEAFYGGLDASRGEIGDERYAQLAALAEEARAHFLADPSDENGRTAQGQRLILEMEAIVEEALRS